MREIKLEAKGADHEAIKAYLEENASEMLAEKINNGVYIEKDGKRLLNKKDLVGFMEYATEEARKQAAKGARSACVRSDVVFGWAIHYFEEDSIIGKLYNEDGTEYKPTVKKSTPKATTPAPAPVKKKEGGQISLFDSMLEPPTTIPAAPAEEPEEEDPHRLVPMPGTEGDWGRRHWGSDMEEVDEDEDEAADVVEEENSEEFDGDIIEDEPKTVPPIITRYRGYVDEEPGAIVVMRVGDFYEVLGKNAKRVAEVVSLAVVSRDNGTGERIPMVGFPFHRKDVYIDKICTLAPVYLVESEDEKVLLRQEREEPTMVINTATGEVFDEPETVGEFDEVLTRFFGKDWVIV